MVMNFFSRVIKATNQSFILIFVAIRNGIKAVFRLINKSIHLFSDAIKILHNFIATIIQLFLNISSIVFILFIPIVFFFDPLNWSRHLNEIASTQALFVVRMLLGAFFSLVAFFLAKELYITWGKSGETKEKEKAPHDFIGFLSKLLSWLFIITLLIYFTIFRFQFIPKDIYFYDFPYWLQDILTNLYPK